MTTREIFTENMLILSEVFKHELSANTMQVYWDLLDPYSDEQVQRAIKEILRTYRFFPKPVELIEVILGRGVHEQAPSLKFDPRDLL